MQILNSMKLPKTNGTPGKLAQPFEVPLHTRALAIIIKATLTIANSTAGAINMNNAQAVDAMTKVFGSFSLKFGEKEAETIDDSEDFATMREMMIAATGRDFLFNGVNLKDYAAGVNVPATGSTTVEVQFVRPFFVEALGVRLDEWCPWASQINSMKLEVKRGGDFSTAGLSQSTDADAVVFVDNIDADAADGWSPVMRIFKNENPGLQQDGPAGAIFKVWDKNAAGAASLFGEISVLRKGDSPLHDKVNVSDIVRASYLRRDQAALNLNDFSCTDLFSLPEMVDKERLPTAAGFQVKASTIPGAYGSFKTRWLYIPPVTEAYVDSFAGPNLAGKDAAVLVNTPSLRSEKLPGNIMAISSIAKIPATHPRAALLDGHAIARVHGTYKRTLYTSPLANSATNNVSGEGAEGLIVANAKERAKTIPGGREISRAAGPSRIVQEVARAASPEGMFSRVMSALRG